MFAFYFLGFLVLLLALVVLLLVRTRATRSDTWGEPTIPPEALRLPPVEGGGGN